MVVKTYTAEMETGVRNILTETGNIVVGGIYCSVQCEGDWGKFYYNAGVFLWKNVHREIPNLFFKFHKMIKNSVRRLIAN